MMQPAPPDTPGIPQRHPNDGWQMAAPLDVSAGTRRRLRVLADAIMPPEPREAGTLDEVVDHVLVSLRYMPRASVRLLLLGLRVLDWSPLWRLRGLRPLRSLPAEAVRRHLQSVMTSRWLAVRLLSLAPRALILSTYFDQDLVHQELGYEPKAFVRSRIELRRRWMLGKEPESSDEIRHSPQVRG